MPPCATCTPPRRCPALVWRLSRLTPLTTILCWSGRVRRTSPCLPLSLPAMTITGSPAASSSQRRLDWVLFFSMSSLQDLRRERDDLHEVALAELAGDRSEDTSPARVVGLGEEHGRVLVEADQRPVGPLVLLVDAHHHGLDDLTLLDLAARLGRLDRGRDDVAHVGVLPVVAAGHADAQELFGSRVVRDLQSGFLLNHSLASLLHDLEHAPALLLGDRLRLGDADEVAQAAFVLLVVDLEPGALLDGLAVQAMCLGRPHLHDHGLVHLVGDDVAQADLAGAARRGRSLDGSGGVAHSDSSSFFLARPRPRFGLGASSSGSGCVSAAPPAATAATSPPSGEDTSSVGTIPKSRSRRTVMIRAMSWRTLEIWLEFSSCPTACLKRSSYSSRLAVRRRMPSSSASRTRSSSTFIVRLPCPRRSRSGSSSAAWPRRASSPPSRPAG